MNWVDKVVLSRAVCMVAQHGLIGFEQLSMPEKGPLHCKAMATTMMFPADNPGVWTFTVDVSSEHAIKRHA